MISYVAHFIKNKVYTCVELEIESHSMCFVYRRLKASIVLDFKPPNKSFCFKKKNYPPLHQSEESTSSSQESTFPPVLHFF